MMSAEATIIVVDDEASIRATLGGILEDDGYKVIGLEKGAEALELMRSSPFDVVITDIRLPDINGLKILRLAKKVNPEVAVIILTGYASVETAVDAVNQGAYAYFVKPVNPDGIKMTIANALKQQRLSVENKKLIEDLQRSSKLLAESNEKLRIDITERKRAEEALRESEERYRALVDLGAEVGEAVVMLQDTEEKIGQYIFVSDEWVHVTGYSRKELLSMSQADLIHPRYRNAAVERHKRRMKGESIPGLFEIAIIRKDGTEVPIELTSAFTTYKGKIAHVCYMRDITERKRAEEALQESEERYRALLELGGEIGEAIIMAQDAEQGEAIHTFVNDEWLRITGYSKEELLGMSFFDLLHPKYRAASRKRHRRKMQGVTIPGLFEMSVIRKDGTEVPIELTSGYTTYKGERAEVAHIRDITERKRAEEALREKNEQLDAQNEELQSQSEELMAQGQELREKNEQLDAQNEELRSQSEELMAQGQELMEKTREVEEASKAKSEFLSHMSHELRTPLNVIIGFSELMLDGVAGEVNEEQRQCLNDILGSGQHLLSLINDVLDLTKVESGKMELKLRNIALLGVIESLRNEMMPLIAKRKQTLEVNVEEGLPPVRADKAKVRQVLINLLSNSTKFTPDGGKLRVEAVKEDSWCRVSVIDNGIGIKKEDQGMVFEPFSQLGNTLPRETGGTGLGLVITKQIIEKHGGRIWVESKYRKGSRFNFTLPLAAAS